MEKNKKRILVIGVMCILVSIFNYNGLILTPPKENILDFHLNLFTINSIMAGFSFTVLTMLLGLSDNETIKQMEETTLISSKAHKIAISLCSFCLSSIVALCFIVQFDKVILIIIETIFDVENLKEVEHIVYASEIYFLVVGILYFIKSIISIYKILLKIYGKPSLRAEKKVEKLEKALAKNDANNQDTQ